jgi:hypothetical protein
MANETQKRVIDYYIFIDYSESLIGYLVIEYPKIKDLLPKISRLRHYRESKKRKLYLKNVKQSFKNNNIKNYFLKFKIKSKIDSIEIYSDVLEFLKRYDNCLIFISVDDNQFKNFKKLLGIIDCKSTKIVKESELKRGTPEYQISLVLDNLLNIERRRIK